jgi:hypothetical protein
VINWNIDATTLAVIFGWATSIGLGILYVVRIRDSNTSLTFRLELSEADRASLHAKYAALDGRISVVNDMILRDYLPRSEMTSLRVEQQNFLNGFKKDVSDTMRHLEERIDKTLHDLAKKQG